MSRLSFFLLPALAWLALPALPAAGQDGHGDHSHHGAPPEVRVDPFELGEIPDTALVDQHGRPVRFRSDLVDGRVVALNFIFTSCTTICPPMGAVFARLQHEMADLPAGREVSFLSVSIDPTTDTPERLAEWAGRFGGLPEWTLLTGEKADVDDLLKKLGVFSALKEDHAPILLLGDDATGDWTRAYGLAPPDRLAEILSELARRAPAEKGEEDAEDPEEDEGEGSLSDLAERGRQIFETGTSPDGPPITAVLGGQDYPLPGEALPCASCHGPDGRGRPEGGAEPSNVTWTALTRPYEVEGRGGRRHPPYDRESLITAFTRGLDPAGNELGIAMPRFGMSPADADALAAYVSTLGEAQEPGVGEEILRLGTLVPAEGRLAEAGRAVEAVLSGVFEEVNAAGGLYGRRLELVVARAEGHEVEAVFEGLLDDDVFAVVAPVTLGADAALVPAADERGLPMVGPITQSPWLPEIPGRTFYLLSGIDQQARVLWDFAAGRRAPFPLAAAVLRSREPNLDSTVEALRRQAERWGALPPEVLGLGTAPEALAGFDAVFLLARGKEAERLVKTLEERRPRPDVLIPGPLAGAFLTRPAENVYLALPDLPEASRTAVESWREFASAHRLPDTHPTFQRLAAVSAELLVAALRNAGRELTRERLVESLEGLYGHPTAWTPRLTFGPNRRIGALGGYVVQADDGPRGFVRATGWIEPRS